MSCSEQFRESDLKRFKLGANAGSNVVEHRWLATQPVAGGTS
jgi:hypothetical protein